MDGECVAEVEDDLLAELIPKVGQRMKVKKILKAMFPDADRKETEEKDSESAEISVDVLKDKRNQDLVKASKIYGKTDPNIILSKWMVAVNDAAYTLCVEDGDLVFDRKKLRELAEEKARQGYSFQKRKGSRSKAAFVDLTETRIVTEERRNRINLLETENTELEKSLRNTKQKILKATQDQNFEECVALKEDVKKKQRKLEVNKGMLHILQKKEKRSLYDQERVPSSSKKQKKATIAQMFKDHSRKRKNSEKDEIGNTLDGIDFDLSPVSPGKSKFSKPEVINKEIPTTMKGSATMSRQEHEMMMKNQQATSDIESCEILAKEEYPRITSNKTEEPTEKDENITEKEEELTRQEEEHTRKEDLTRKEREPTKKEERTKKEEEPKRNESETSRKEEKQTGKEEGPTRNERESTRQEEERAKNEEKATRKEEEPTIKEITPTRKEEERTRKEDLTRKEIEPTRKEEESIQKEEDPMENEEEVTRRKVEDPPRKEREATRKEENLAREVEDPPRRKEEETAHKEELTRKEEETTRKEEDITLDSPIDDKASFLL